MNFHLGQLVRCNYRYAAANEFRPVYDTIYAIEHIDCEDQIKLKDKIEKEKDEMKFNYQRTEIDKSSSKKASKKKYQNEASADNPFAANMPAQSSYQPLQQYSNIINTKALLRKLDIA